MKTIYVMTPGTVIRRAGRRLILDTKDERRFEAPLKDVGRLLIYAPAEVTAQTIAALLDEGIGLYYVRRNGSLRGKISPTECSQVSVRRHQHRYFSDPRFAMAMAREIIASKLRNMKTVLIYLLQKKQGTKSACLPLDEAISRLNECDGRDQLMGVEGAAARHYFEIYGAQLPEDFRFKVRSRQPARDATNALLNLGYMTLFREVLTHLEAHQFDPYLGLLHATEDGRPSLALDVMEQFRQPMVDLFIVRLLRLEQIRKEDFVNQEDGAVTMTQEGLVKFFRLYEASMGKQDGENPGMRKVIDDQVCLLKKSLKGEGEYRHFQIDVE